jgi:nucleoside-diphosphate-sugar epimerase
VQPRVTGATGTYEFEHLSSARARDLLGWKPAYSLEQGLRETFAWYRDARAREAVGAGA